MRILQIVEAVPGEGACGLELIPALAALGHDVDWCPAVPSSGAEPPDLRVERMRPDVLWIGNAVRRDARFLSTLARRPFLIVGWAAEPPPVGTDWTGFDLILTGDPACLERAPALGARKAALFHPACPDQAATERPALRWDIVFRGAVTPQPGVRLNALRELAKAPLGFRGECNPVFFLSGADLGGLPAGLHLYNQGELSDRNLPEVMACTRMALLFRDEPPATADPFVLAALSSGTLLLAERGSAAERLFDPDREFLRFTTPQELLDLLYAHQGESTAAPVIGQARKRCLDGHGVAARAAELATLLVAQSAIGDVPAVR